MEKELGGIETRVEAVFHEAFGRGMTRVTVEVGQAPLGESIGDTLALQGLLAHTGNHLGKVDIGPFAPTKEHLQGRIGRLELLAANITDFVSDFAECAVDVTFKGLFGVASRFVGQGALLIGLDKILTFLVAR